MGTRPKPTEHMATSEDEAANRRQVAGVAGDAAAGRRVPEVAPPLEYRDIYPEPPMPVAAGVGHLPPVVDMPPLKLEPASPSYASQTEFIPVAGPSGLQLPPSPLPAKPPPHLLRRAGPSGTQKLKTDPSDIYRNPKKFRAKKFACDLCQKTFSTLAKLQAHTKSGHSRAELATAPSTTTTTATATATTPSPPPQTDVGAQFSCEHCNKNFSSKFKLVRHVLIHSDRRQFSCTVCERTFHRKDHLKNHIKVHNPTKKVYVCDRESCRKEYTSALRFKKHLAMHFAEEGHLDCKICTKKFETKTDILYHLKVHAGSGTVKNPNEKKFRCEFCERKFFTRKDVRRHLVVHTGRRDFLCQFCPQRFGRKDHLVRHIKKSHSSEDLLAVKREPDVDVPSTLTIKTELGYEAELAASTSVAAYFGDDDLKRSATPPPLLPPDLLQPEYVEDAPRLLAPEFQTESLFEATSFASLSPMLATQATVLLDEQQQQTALMDTADMEVLKSFEQHTVTSEILEHDFQLDEQSSVLSDPDILELICDRDLLPSSDEDSKPLPGFSQAFQNPP